MMDYGTIRDFKFSKRPISISAEYRPLFKVAQIVLVLKHASIKEQASILKLHLFSWAMRSQRSMRRLTLFIESDREQTKPKVWTLAPSVNRAVDFALSEQLVEKHHGLIRLTEKGRAFGRAIEADETLLEEERAFLADIGKKVSEAEVQRLSKNWT